MLWRAVDNTNPRRRRLWIAYWAVDVVSLWTNAKTLGSQTQNEASSRISSHNKRGGHERNGSQRLVPDPLFSSRQRRWKRRQARDASGAQQLHSGAQNTARRGGDYTEATGVPALHHNKYPTLSWIPGGTHQDATSQVRTATPSPPPRARHFKPNFLSYINSEYSMNRSSVRFCVQLLADPVVYILHALATHGGCTDT